MRPNRQGPTSMSMLASTMNPGLLFERDGAVATLTLNRPTSGNALDLDLAKAFMSAAIDCDEDPAIRCVVLTGAGSRFCVGGDLAAFAAADHSIPAFLKELTAYMHSAMARLARMEKPLVTVINGAAAGAGMSLAVLGDIALAARSAHFTMAYTAVGLTPDCGATWLLPRLIGLRRAQEMMLENRRVTAEEAAALGLVTRVVEDGELASEAARVAHRLARSATFALGCVRGLLQSSTCSSFETQMEHEARAISKASRHPHGREGVGAFLEKRQPTFTD